MTYNDDLGRPEDEVEAELLDEIAVFSFFGRGARFLFNVVTFFVFDDEVRGDAQRMAKRMEEKADVMREIKKRKRSQYRKDHPWR